MEKVAYTKIRNSFSDFRILDEETIISFELSDDKKEVFILVHNEKELTEIAILNLRDFERFKNLVINMNNTLRVLNDS